MQAESLHGPINIRFTLDNICNSIEFIHVMLLDTVNMAILMG